MVDAEDLGLEAFEERLDDVLTLEIPPRLEESLLRTGDFLSDIVFFVSGFRAVYVKVWPFVSVSWVFCFFFAEEVRC